MIYGIDANALLRPQRTGVERYVHRLLTEMMAVPLGEGERVVLYSSAPLKDFAEFPTGWKNRVLRFALPKGWTHARLSWELLRRPPDIFFSPAHEVPLYVGKKTKIVSTVHDLAFRRVPEVYAPREDKRQKWAINRAIKKAAKLLAVSETTKRDAMELYGVPDEKVAVTRLGVDPSRFLEKEAVVFDVLRKYRLAPGRYLLSVGRLEEKKNVVTIIRAFAELKKALGVGHPLTLVLAGNFGFGKERIVRALQGVPDVQVMGYVPDADLPSLMKGALALCFASHYEGFGLPVLEAFAAGTPVLLSDIPAFHEVAGDAALYAGTTDVAAWKKHMERLLLDETVRGELVLKGSARVRDFSWSTTAQTTWKVLRSFA